MTTEKMTEVGDEAMQKVSPESVQKDTETLKKDKKDDQEKSEDEIRAGEMEELKIQLQEQKDKFLRLFAEFDNFKKRTSRERLDIMKTAGQDIMEELIPVLDDLDRATKSLAESDDIVVAREGFALIREKIFKKLENRGLEPMESLGSDFNPDLHEAITEIPVDDEAMKGKVVEVIEKGYTLNNKIIRYAKVVVGR